MQKGEAMADLIDRQAVIDASCTCYGGKHCNHYPCKDVQAIMDLPVIRRTLEEAEPKKGKWIHTPIDTKNNLWEHTCGECGKFSWTGGKVVRFKCCPICEARMVDK